MILGIDHVVILVDDLGKASADYRELGFTVVEGGEHAGGLSHNALVAFEDGSYLELIAFRTPIPENHLFYRLNRQEGLVTYALLPDDITGDIEAARRRGLELEGPVPGGRLRPDGLRVDWQIGTPATRDLPFLCADVTPRELRVPYGPARLHANGVQGIAAITVAVEDIAASVARYSALLGSEPTTDFIGQEPDMQAATFHFENGNANVVLMQPGEGPIREYLLERREGPYSLVLRAGAGTSQAHLDIERTHGVRLAVAGD